MSGYNYQSNERRMPCQREQFPGLCGPELLVAALQSGAEVALHCLPGEQLFNIGAMSRAFGLWGWSVAQTGLHGPNGEAVVQYWLRSGTGKVWVFEPRNEPRPGWTHSPRFGWQSAERLAWLESYHGEAVAE